MKIFSFINFKLTKDCQINIASKKDNFSLTTDHDMYVINIIYQKKSQLFVKQNKDWF